MTIRVTDKWKLTRATVALFVVLGTAMGACSLGMKLSICDAGSCGEYELVVGQK